MRNITSANWFNFQHCFHGMTKILYFPSLTLITINYKNVSNTNTVFMNIQIYDFRILINYIRDHKQLQNKECDEDSTTLWNSEKSSTCSLYLAGYIEKSSWLTESTPFLRNFVIFVKTAFVGNRKYIQGNFYKLIWLENAYIVYIPL